MWKEDSERYGNDCVIKDKFIYSGGVLYHTKSYRGSWTPDEPEHYACNMTEEEVYAYLVDNADVYTVQLFLNEYPNAKPKKEVNVIQHIENCLEESGDYSSGLAEEIVEYLEERGIYFELKEE